jgi:chorismate--pyruvate lyase
MQVKRIDKWLNGSELTNHLTKKNILDWLEEEGSITARISSRAEFKLEILNDDIGFAEDEEYIALEIPPEEVRIREVVLFGDLVPLVYARSIIPELTALKGYPGLGTIGSKPLGDLLFQSELFVKTRREFAQFQSSSKEVFWGRRTHYLVRGYPLTVMEVFLLS